MRPVKYSLNDDYGIYVEERGPNSWAVTYSRSCMSVSGEWSYELMPSNRTEEFIKEHRFSTPEAAEQAYLEHKSKLRINGKTL